MITRSTGEVTAPESRGGRLVAVMLLALLLLAGVAYVLLAWFTSGKIPHGTSVEGVGIGGLTPTAAEQRLRDQLAGRSNRELVMTWQGHVFRVDPGAAGLAIDYAATVREAGGRFSLDPARVWHYFAGGDELPAQVSIVESSMTAQLARIAALVDRKPLEGTITFAHGRARPVYSRAGLALDRGATRELLVREFREGGRARLPVVPDQPYVTADAVHRAMRDFARPAMQAPVVLVVGGQAIIATPEEYSGALTMVPSRHQLRPVVDGEQLLEGIRPAMTTVGDRPRDARIRLVDGSPRIIPERIGATFDVADLAARFAAYAAKPPGERRMPVKAVVQQPAFTNADARALGVTDVVAQATAGFGEGANDAVAAMAQSLSGRLVRPRGVLPVHAPGADNGADNGAVNGAVNGGATSVVASTLYSAAFAAGLGVVERTPLPTYHPAFALGIDARVDADHRLRLRDNTPYGVLVDVGVRAARPGHPGAVTVRLWSTRHWDVTTSTGPRRGVTGSPVRYDATAGCRPATGTDGFTVTVTRVLRHDGEIADRGAFTSTYRATPTVVCHSASTGSGSGPAPAPAPTPTPGPGPGPGNGHGHGPPGPG